MTLTLPEIRRKLALALIALAWLHVPLLALAQTWRDGPETAPLAAAGVLALAATLCWRMSGGGLLTRLMVACALIGQVSLLVYSFAGHPWQPDLHMYYFAILALLAGFADWRPIVLGAALTALHHLVLQFALPAAVFYQGGSIARVLLHAAIVIIETGFLAVLAIVIEKLLDANEAATRDAQLVAKRERALHLRERETAEQLAFDDERVRSTIAEFSEVMDRAQPVFESSAQTMQQAVSVLFDASAHASQEIDRVSASAEATSAGMTELARSSGQLAHAIADIGRSATRSAAETATASTAARRASEELSELERNCLDVGSVVEIIRGIAAQTNLLALNATIEAARAGDSGRGFAIVAGEVKALSAQTAAATDRIASQIAGMKTAQGRSTSALRDIVVAIEQLEETAAAIERSVHLQDRATSDIARQVGLSSDGARRDAESAESIREVTVKTHAAAQELRHAADALGTQAETIRENVANFCRKLSV